MPREYITKEEKNAKEELGLKKINGSLSSGEAIFLKELDEKDTKHIQCSMFLRFSEVEQLPPP